MSSMVKRLGEKVFLSGLHTRIPKIKLEKKNTTNLNFFIFDQTLAILGGNYEFFFNKRPTFAKLNLDLHLKLLLPTGKNIYIIIKTSNLT